MRWRLFASRRSRDTPECRLRFRCNVCSRWSERPEPAFARSEPSCPHCGSSVRHRSVVHVLSVELFGRCLPIDEWPERKDVAGVGLSDWVGYARRLARKLDYTNTWLHREPRLDIAAVPDGRAESCDFLISSDVFEHVERPVERAFDGVRKLLKPDGFAVFCVPWATEGDTVEHYPVFKGWRVEVRDGEKVVVGTDEAGQERVFPDPVFHGGRGTTLEMRRFSYEGIVSCCRSAGLATPPRVVGGSHLACGMVHSWSWSLPMVLRR